MRLVGVDVVEYVRGVYERGTRMLSWELLVLLFKACITHMLFGGGDEVVVVVIVVVVDVDVDVDIFLRLLYMYTGG